MYYLIDYDSLYVLFQHAKKAVLKAYVKDNGLTLATEIINVNKDLTSHLTRQEMMIMYENITLESLPIKHSISEMGELLFRAIAEETYSEPTDKATPPTEETVKPNPKPKPQTTKPATGDNTSLINPKELIGSIIGLGSAEPVKRIHKQICNTLEGSDMGYKKLMEELTFELDKDEKYLCRHIRDCIRKEILTITH